MIYAFEESWRLRYWSWTAIEGIHAAGVRAGPRDSNQSAKQWRRLAILCCTLLWTWPLLLAAAQENWHAPDPEAGGKSRCVVRTGILSLNDGYQETPVHLELDRKNLRVVTDSNLDVTTTPLGLSVDKGPFVAADRVEHDTTLVFEREIEPIIEQFIAGSRVRVLLRFWPTWPETGDKFAEFSLIGFTRAFNALSACSG